MACESVLLNGSNGYFGLPPIPDTDELTISFWTRLSDANAIINSPANTYLLQSPYDAWTARGSLHIPFTSSVPDDAQASPFWYDPFDGGMMVQADSYWPDPPPLPAVDWVKDATFTNFVPSTLTGGVWINVIRSFWFVNGILHASFVINDTVLQSDESHLSFAQGSFNAFYSPSPPPAPFNAWSTRARFRIASNPASGSTTNTFVIGSNSTLTSGWVGAVSELWIAPRRFDLTNATNRRRFNALSGGQYVPQNLGSNGSNPLGFPPWVYCTGNATDFAVNRAGGLLIPTGSPATLSDAPYALCLTPPITTPIPVPPAPPPVPPTIDSGPDGPKPPITNTGGPPDGGGGPGSGWPGDPNVLVGGDAWRTGWYVDSASGNYVVVSS